MVDSTGRFLLGGALGAALGYLQSQNSQERPQEPAGQIPVAATEAPALATPAVFLPLTSTAASALRIPPAPPSDWRPEIEVYPVISTPDALGSTSEPAVEAPAISVEPMVLEETDLEVEPESFTEPVESEVIVRRELLDEPLPGSGWRSTAPLEVGEETIESATQDLPQIELSPFGPEIARSTASVPVAPLAPSIVDWTADREEPQPEVVEESVEVPTVEEQTELPVVEEAPLDESSQSGLGTAFADQTSDLLGRIPAVETSLAEDSSRVDDLKSRIEETRRRIRHELEQPFNLSASSKTLEHDWTSAPAVPIVEQPEHPQPDQNEPASPAPAAAAPSVMEETATDGQAVVQAQALELREVETLPVEPVAIEALPHKLEPDPEPVFEPQVAETVVAPALEPVVEPAVERPVEPVAASTATDLPPIKRPLFELRPAAPTVNEPTVSPTAAQVVQPTAEPTVAPAVAASPLDEPLARSPLSATRAPEPAAAKPTSFTPLYSEPAMSQPVSRISFPPVESELEMTEDEPGVAEGSEEHVDYDSMKNRIESTRSRLKAKAFDAMMTGEAALLGRDVEGAVPAPNRAPGVDVDIDQTIETSLREEEE